MSKTVWPHFSLFVLYLLIVAFVILHLQLLCLMHPHDHLHCPFSLKWFRRSSRLCYLPLVLGFKGTMKIPNWEAQRECCWLSCDFFYHSSLSYCKRGHPLKMLAIAIAHPAFLLLKTVISGWRLCSTEKQGSHLGFLTGTISTSDCLITYPWEVLRHLGYVFRARHLGP
jgi:hypothetical protein